MSDPRERKNKTIALITSLGIHLAVLLAFLFMMAWRAPNPPLPEYGIELNFGLDDQGAGDIQPETPASSEEVPTDEPPTDEISTEPLEEQEEESKPVEEVVEQPVSKEESPVVVKETKKEIVVKPVKEDTKKEEKKEVKVADTKPADENGNPKLANQGDDTNKVGDKGSEEGSLDAKALYGKQGGGGGGVGLDLAGWNWDEIPRPNIPNNESNGRIVFEIKVDENGEILSYRVLEKTLSIEAEKACKQAIEKLTFSKKSGATVPDVSTGKISFVVRTQ
jgi:periplasmic protein TonB